MTSFSHDLFGFAVIFAVCWPLYLIGHWLAASAGVVRGVGPSTVAIAIGAAVVMAGASWFWLGTLFSSAAVHHFACVVAPFAFVGFCGNYVLVGPVTVDRSITLTILSALASSKTHGLTEVKLHAEVPFDRIFAKRLRELSRTGNLTTEGEIRITKRGLRNLMAYQWLSRTFKVDFQ